MAAACFIETWGITWIYSASFLYKRRIDLGCHSDTHGLISYWLVIIYFMENLSTKHFNNSHNLQIISQYSRVSYSHVS